MIRSKKYENKSAKDIKTFIGDLSEALNLRNNGNNSNYGDYVAVNGKEVTIRVSDHNVSVKDMDDAGKVNGISIVVSHESNEDALIKKMQQNKLLHLNEKFLNSDKRLIEPQGEGSDLVPTPNSVSSKDKDTEISETSQSLNEKVAAESGTDTSPTEGQEEAGNYQKGFVQIETFS